MENGDKLTSLHKRDHAELGGSNAFRWANCTGSVFLGRNVPEPAPSQAAVQGTKAHYVAEQYLKAFLDHKRHGSSPIPDKSLVSDVPEEMIQTAQEYVQAIWEQILEQTITNKVYGLEEDFIFDQHLSMYGYVDFWCIYIDDKAQRTGAICDFKYGYHHVSAKKNSQLAFYACAMRRWARANGKDLDRVRVAIFQPRSFDEEEGAYREVSFSAKQLNSWESKFEKAAHQIYVQQKPKFKVGEWCRFCPAQAVCPKYVKDLETKTDLQVLSPETISLPAPETLSDGQLRKIIEHSDDIDAFISACKAYCLNRHQNGKPVEGLKVVLGSTRRKWKENEQEIGKVLMQMGVQEPFQYKLKPLTQIEKMIGKEKIEPYIERTAAKPVLVPATDEREEAKSFLNLLDN